MGLLTAQAAIDQVKTLKQSCTNDDGYACALLGQMYLKGHSVEPNNRLFLAFSLKGCELGAMQSCTVLGSAYHEGKVIKRDYRKALRYIYPGL